MFFMKESVYSWKDNTKQHIISSPNSKLPKYYNHFMPDLLIIIFEEFHIW